MSGLSPAPDQLAVPDRPSISERFHAFDRAHPEVYAALVNLCREWRGTRCSIGMFWEVLRWQSVMGGDGEWRLDNSLRSRYSRKLIAEHPEFADLFEVRTLRAA